MPPLRPSPAGASRQAALHAHGFDDEDIWDIAAITSFFGLSNRMASFAGMQPNPEFFLLGRVIDVDPLTQTPGIVPEGEVAVSWTEGFSESMEWLGSVQMKKGYYKEYFERVVPLETSSELGVPVLRWCYDSRDKVC